MRDTTTNMRFNNNTLIELTSSSAAGAHRLKENLEPAFYGSIHTATLAVCTVLVMFVLIMGMFGNGLVLLTGLQCRRLRSNIDLLVYNLAAVDLVICSCLAPMFLYLLFFTPSVADRELCGGFFFVSTFCTLVSLLTLVVVAVHRKARVTGRIRRELTLCKVTALLVLIYLISMTLSLSGMLYAFHTWPDSSTTNRSGPNNSSLGLNTNNVIMYFVTPVVLISYITISLCYFLIARTVRIQSHSRVKSLQPLLKQYTSDFSKLNITNKTESASSVGSQEHVEASPELKQIHVQPWSYIRDRTSSYQQTAALVDKNNGKLIQCSCCKCMLALDKENKAVTMCVVVVLIVSLCWTPLFIAHIVRIFFNSPIVILNQVKLCGIALVFLNSALNPYMYAHNCERAANNSQNAHRFINFLWDLFRCDCRIFPRSHKKFKCPYKIADGDKTLMRVPELGTRKPFQQLDLSRLLYQPKPNYHREYRHISTPCRGVQKQKRCKTERRGSRYNIYNKDIRLNVCELKQPRCSCKQIMPTLCKDRQTATDVEEFLVLPV